MIKVDEAGQEAKGEPMKKPTIKEATLTALEQHSRIDRIGLRIIQFNAHNAPAFCFVTEAKLLLSIFAKKAAKDRKAVLTYKRKLKAKKAR